MHVEIWQGVAAVVAALGGALIGRRTGKERNADVAKAIAEASQVNSESATDLLRAYGLLIDRHEKSLEDARAHIHRQGDELRGVREELRVVRESRELEIAGLRAELISVRGELAEERAENGRLRDRLDAIERAHPGA